MRHREGLVIINDKDIEPVEIGKGVILNEGNDVAVLNLGSRLQSCHEAIKILNINGINPTLADARFAKPIDTDLLDQLLDNHKYLLTIEDGSSGGFSASVLNYIHNKRIKITSTKVNNIFFPDKFVDHQSPDDQYSEIGMDATLLKDAKIYEDNVINFQSYNKNINNYLSKFLDQILFDRKLAGQIKAQAMIMAGQFLLKVN